MEKIKAALTHPILSLPLAGRFMAVLRPAMQKAGIHDFPVIALIGEPGSGKTSIMRAVSGDSNEILSFQRQSKEVIAALQSHRDSFSVIDDFADLGSDLGRRSQLNLLDKIVRRSYSGELGQVGVTIEKTALARTVDSCRQRMLIVDIGEGVADQECSELVYALAESTELEFVVEAFKMYIAERSVPFIQNLKSFRQGLTKLHSWDSRTATLVFVYAETMTLLNDFFIEEGLGNLSETARYEIINALLSQRRKEPVPLEEILLQKLLRSNELNVQHCFVRDECSLFCSQGCLHRSQLCEESCSLFDIDPSRVTTYAPTDIFLDFADGYNALLIDEPNMVPHFRRDYSVPPFLIINEATFTMLMNMILKEYCMDHHLFATYFSGPTLRKKLFELNRCMVRINEDKGYRYTFTHPSITEVGVSQTQAVAIFLLPEEVSALKATSHGQVWNHQRRLAYAEEVPRIINALRKTWVHFTAGVTPVGTLCPEHL